MYFNLKSVLKIAGFKFYGVVLKIPVRCPESTPYNSRNAWLEHVHSKHLFEPLWNWTKIDNLSTTTSSGSRDRLWRFPSRKPKHEFVPIILHCLFPKDVLSRRPFSKVWSPHLKSLGLPCPDPADRFENTHIMFFWGHSASWGRSCIWKVNSDCTTLSLVGKQNMFEKLDKHMSMSVPVDFWGFDWA